MTSAPVYIGLAFTGLLLLAAFTDVRERRIPNSLTVTGILAGPVLWGLLAGPGAAVGAMLGAGLALVVGMALFALGALGGGDAKLLAVVGAFLGPVRLLVACLVIAVLGGVLALSMAIGTRRLGPTLISTWMLGLNLVTFGRRGSRMSIDSPGSHTLPYGAVIAAGAMVTWFFLPMS